MESQKKHIEVLICKRCLIEKPIDRFRLNVKICRKCNNMNWKKWHRKKGPLTNEQKEKRKDYLKSVNYRQSEAYKRNKKKVRKKAKIKDRETLHRRYVYSTLRSRGFDREYITQELIETQKIILKTKRLCKTLQNLETV